MNNLKRRSKTLKLIGIISIFLVLAVITVGIILYFNTDIFKSDEEVFQRQFLENVEVINKFIDSSSEVQYGNLLEENNFNENMIVDLKYINNDGREDNFVGNITGISDNKNDLAYKDIKINFGSTNVMKMTYLKEADIYGIRFIEGTKFAVIDTANNITPVLKYLEIDDIISSEKVNVVKLSDILNIAVSNDEIGKLQKQYLSIILQNIIEDNYSSEKDKIISSFYQKSIKTNAYKLTLDANQVEIIYKNMLNQLSKDEIILGKLETIDNKLKEIGIKVETGIKTLFTQTINQQLNSIDIKSGMVITIYESKGSTIKTTIEYSNKLLEIYKNNENELTIKFFNDISDDTKYITASMSKENNILKVSYEDNNNITIEYIRQLNINSNDIKSATSVKYADANIKGIELNIDRNIKLGDIDEIPTSFEKSGKVLLNDYDDKSTSKNLEDLKNRIIKLLREKRDETNSQLLNYLIEYNNEVEEEKKNEEENKRKKFNSKFELYEGEKLEKNIVLNLLDEAGRHMSNYDMTADNQIKIYIEEGRENKELVNEIKEKMEQIEQQKKYNIYLKYDNKAKINQIIIQPFIEQQ